MHDRAHAVVVASTFVVGPFLTACGSGDGNPAATAAPAAVTTIEAEIEADLAAGTVEQFPDVLDAAATVSDGVWRFSATLSSPYDTPARYADAWRVVGDDGVVYGIRELTHDHQAEQPFTRSLSGVEIPVGVATVTIEGRDQVSGWGGQTFQVALG